MENLIGKKVRGFKFEPYKYGDLSYPEDSMDRYVGKIGVIQEYGTDKDRVRVQFDYDFWWYPLAEIEPHLVEEKVEKTYPVTRKQLSEIYDSVCDKWKSEINTIIDNGGRFSESFEVPQSLIWKARAEANTEQYQWIDSVFGEVGKASLNKWYFIENKNCGTRKTDALVYIKEFKGDGNTNYGFDSVGNWTEQFWTSDLKNMGRIVEATPQEVEKALTEEAKRRYKVGDKLSKITADCSSGERKFSTNLSYQESNNSLWINNDNGYFSCIFQNGVWAEVIKQDKIEVGDWAYLEESGFKKVRFESQAKALSNKGWSKVTDEQVLEVLNNYKLD